MFVVLALLSGGILSGVPRPAGGSPEDRLAGSHAGTPSWVAGEVIVQYRSGARGRGLSSLANDIGARVSERVPLFDLAVVRLEKGVSVPEGVRRLQHDPAVKSVTPNYVTRFAAVPDDPRFEEQWGMHNVGQPHVSTVVGGSPRGRPDADIDAPRAWKTEEGSADTVVAVVDTGVDIRHPDLDGSIWTNPGEIAHDGIDNDSNGFVDDVHGWDVAENDNTLVERDKRAIPYQHGTHVAGTIAAEKDNNLGVSGVCPGCKIMPIKVSRAVGVEGERRYMSARLSDELEGLAYAQSMGADVVNASFGRTRWIRAERDAFLSLGRAGIVSVVAAGNITFNLDVIARTALLDASRVGRRHGISYPAAYDIPSIVSVAASTDHDQYGTFSNFGRDSVDLAAPGVDIFSTIPGRDYQLLSGTSMAAPHVSGAAGLIKSRRPSSSPSDLRHMLMNSVDTPGRMSLRAGRRSGFVTRTLGRLNAADALDASAKGEPAGRDGTIRGARHILHRATGRLRSPRDFNDVFVKPLRGGDRVVLRLRSRRSPLDLFVWKPGTKDIWQLEEECFVGERTCRLRRWKAGPSSVKRISFEVGRSGPYFFHVSARGDERSRYKLTVTTG